MCCAQDGDYSVQVQIVEVMDLVSREYSGMCDPYVAVEVRVCVSPRSTPPTWHGVPCGVAHTSSHGAASLAGVVAHCRCPRVPLVQVMGVKKKTRWQKQVNSCVFDETFYFNFEGLKKEQVRAARNARLVDADMRICGVPVLTPFFCAVSRCRYVCVPLSLRVCPSSFPCSASCRWRKGRCG